MTDLAVTGMLREALMTVLVVSAPILGSGNDCRINNRDLSNNDIHTGTDINFCPENDRYFCGNHFTCFMDDSDVNKLY